MLHRVLCFTLLAGLSFGQTNWGWQNFAANGYTMLLTNPRGSTGYGQDFVSGIQHSYPGKD